MLKLNLPIQKLDEFLNLSKFIKSEDNEIRPYFRYIKIEVVFGTCIMTKTNNNSFCIFSFNLPEAEDDEFLIEEQKLKAIRDLAKDQNIEIHSNGEFIELKVKKANGKHTQICNSGGYKVSDLPLLPEVNNIGIVRLDKETLSALSSAKNFVSNDDLRPGLNCVYLSGKYIYASSGYSFYAKECKIDLPDIAITKQESSLLSSLEQVDYTKSGNYNIYKSGSTTYGFIQPDGATGFNFKMFFEKATKQNYVTVNIDAFIDFCESTSKFSEDSYSHSMFTVKQNTSEVVFLEKTKDQKNSMEVTTSLVGNPFSFAFNASQWLTLLKSLNYIDINISTEDQVMCLWNDRDPSYFGLISKIVA